MLTDTGGFSDFPSGWFHSIKISIERKNEN